MQSVLRLLFDLCLLRSGPQQLPHSLPLLRALFLACAALKLVSALLLEIPEPLARTLLSLALLLGIPWLLLALRGHRNRYVQTLSALTGTGLLFTLVLLPLLLIASAIVPAGVPVAGEAPPPAQLAVGWMTLLLLGWKLAINANIYRHALDWGWLSAALLSLSLFLIEFGIFRSLFPAAVTT